jgi:hypothetical protein
MLGVWDGAALEHALHSHALGLDILPLPPRLKYPKRSGWQNGDRLDDAQLRAHWQREPNANHGIRTGRPIGDGSAGYLAVVDVDAVDPEALDEALGVARAWLGDLERYPAVRTGSGGLHLYARTDRPMKSCVPFKSADRVHVGDKLKRRWQLELVAVGRQVVGPGSIHPNGKAYTWTRPLPINTAPMLPATSESRPDAPQIRITAFEVASGTPGNAEDSPSWPVSDRPAELARLAEAFPSAVQCYAARDAAGRWRAARDAFKSAYIATGRRGAFVMLAVDVDDQPDAGNAWSREHLPPPHFIVGRHDRDDSVHLIWLLQRPVSRAGEASTRWFHAIRKAFTAACRGDISYNGHRVKSPAAACWTSTMPAEAPRVGYMLAELAAAVDLTLTPRRKGSRTAVSGECPVPVGERHAALFETLRRKAYRGVQRASDPDAFTADCMRWAEVVNAQFAEPQVVCEVHAVARAVAAYAWRHRSKLAIDFTAMQRARSKRGNAVKSSKAADRWAEAVAMCEAGRSWAEIGEAFGVSADAARKGVSRQLAKRSDTLQIRIIGVGDDPRIPASTPTARVPA